MLPSTQVLLYMVAESIGRSGVAEFGIREARTHHQENIKEIEER
jgi:hypothetical protein